MGCGCGRQRRRGRGRGTSNESSRVVPGGAAEMPGYVYDAVRHRYFRKRPPGSSLVDMAPLPSQRRSDWEGTRRVRSSSSSSIVHWCRHREATSPSPRTLLSGLACRLCPSTPLRPAHGATDVHVHPLDPQWVVMGCPQETETERMGNTKQNRNVEGYDVTQVVMTDAHVVRWSHSRSYHFLAGYFGGAGISGRVRLVQADEGCALSVLSARGSLWTLEWRPHHPDQFAIGVTRKGRIINLHSRHRYDLPTDGSDVFALQFDQGGTVVMTGSRDGIIRTFDLRCSLTTHSGVTTLRHHHSIRSISCLRSLRDDYGLVSSSMAGEIVRWDRRTNRPLLSYEGQVGARGSLRFDIDSSEALLASGSGNGHLLIWDLRRGGLPLHNIAAWKIEDEGDISGSLVAFSGFPMHAGWQGPVGLWTVGYASPSASPLVFCPVGGCT